MTARWSTSSTPSSRARALPFAPLAWNRLGEAVRRVVGLRLEEEAIERLTPDLTAAQDHALLRS